MNFEFTPQKLKMIIPNNRDTVKLHAAMSEILPQYNIDTIERVSMFVGQCAVESIEFNVMTENLNYSQTGLLRVFRKYFDANSAKAYARQPEKIANRVYANRMGNGPESSGDGWKFRGHGFIQLTGRYNHTLFADSMKMSIEEELSYIKTLEGSLRAACFFWANNDLNRYADRLDIVGATKRINGGTHGLAERKRYVRLALTTFEAKETVTTRTFLRKGDRGPDVFDAQQKLSQKGYNVHADGIFGNGTRNAVVQFQTDHGLTSDGVIGPQTKALLYA